MRRSRFVVTALSYVALVATGSCGAVLSRLGMLRQPEPQPTFFAGVRFDAMLIGGTIKDGEVPLPVRIVAVPDTPLSLVMDIVLLPVDAVLWITRSPETTRGASPEDDSTETSKRTNSGSYPPRR